MLTGPRFCDYTSLAETLGDQDLSDRIVDMVTSEVQVSSRTRFSKHGVLIEQIARLRLWIERNLPHATIQKNLNLECFLGILW